MIETKTKEIDIKIFVYLNKFEIFKNYLFSIILQHQIKWVETSWPWRSVLVYVCDKDVIF